MAIGRFRPSRTQVRIVYPQSASWCEARSSALYALVDRDTRYECRRIIAGLVGTWRYWIEFVADAGRIMLCFVGVESYCGVRCSD